MAKKNHEVSERSKAIARAMGRVSAVRNWRRTEPPRPLRTSITSLNRAFRIGGVPTRMVGIFHGPSQAGKSILGTEILRAACETGGFGLLCDSENRSNDLDWFSALHGEEALSDIFRWPESMKDKDGNRVEEPRTYEGCVEKVEKVRGIFRTLKDEGTIPPRAVFAFVVDSIDRLMPEEELKDFQKAGLQGRAYPLRAMMNGQWLDKLVNTLKPDELAVWIVRESTKLDAGQYEEKWRMRGGKALEFDSGWIVRVGSGSDGASRNAKVSVALPGHKDKVRVGERHEFVVRKSSTSNKLGQKGCFFIGSGLSQEMSLGFDRGREVREEAILRGVFLKRGQSFFVESAAAEAMGIPEETGVKSREALAGWLKEDEKRMRLFADYLDGCSVSWADREAPDIMPDKEEQE